MARFKVRFNIEIEDGVVLIGNTWSKEQVPASEIDAFVAAVKAAGAFALANSITDNSEPENNVVGESEASEFETVQELA